MKIAIDVMGGDRAPDVNVQGAALMSLEAKDFELVLVGSEPAIKESLAELPHNPDRISIVHTDVVVGMDESATLALREKKDSSISTAIRLHKENKVQGVVSAGNTGAMVAASLVGLGRIKGVSRPAISVLFPTQESRCVLLDVGANSTCKPAQLLQFAHMGSIYAHEMLGRENPTVGLLSIGEERAKGNDLTVETNKLLRDSILNFAGNIEGNDILRGTVDVVVCDGFVGNVVLKFAESITGLLKNFLSARVADSLRYKMGGLLIKPMVVDLMKSFKSEEYGGAPLLGINGNVLIAHGGSTATAICNAVRAIHKMLDININGQIESRLKS